MCIYLKKKTKKIQKKKIQDFQSFPKKRENFSNEKNLWTKGIELPNDFFKKAHFFFSFKDFKIKKKKKKSHFQNGTWGSFGQNIF